MSLDEPTLLFALRAYAAGSLSLPAALAGSLTVALQRVRFQKAAILKLERCSPRITVLKTERSE